MLQFFDTLQDISGNALAGSGTLAVTLYPGGGAAPIYSTNGTASPIVGSLVTADATGQVSFFIPDGSYIFTYANSGTTYKIRSPVQALDPMSFVAVTDTGAANAYVVTDSRLPASLFIGLKFEWKAANANTIASTLNLNSTGAQPLNLPGGAGVGAGTIQAGGIYRVEWDGTEWQIVGSTVTPLFAKTPIEIAAGTTIVNSSYEPYDVRRYGADQTGVADSSAAFNAAPSLSFVFPGTYKTNSVVTAGKPIVSFNASFTGTNPVNGWMPNFGANDFVVMEFLGGNAIVGAVENQLAPATASFPTGVTGYGRTNNAGNSVFGLFGQADLYATGNAVGAEIDSFNYAAAPVNAFPVNLAFGTTGYNAIASLLAAYGNFQSIAGLYIAIGAQQFIAGIYIHYQACSQYGILIDSGSAQGPAQPLYVKGMSSVIPAIIQTIGTFAANNAVLSVLDQTTATRMSIKQDGHLSMSATATSASTGANGAVPAQVAGYFIAEVVGGALVKIPYFNT